MIMYICLNCYGVSTCPSGKCCNQKVEVFDSIKHGELLFGASNAWASVWNRWKNDPLLCETSSKLARDNCYSCSTIINEFIQELYNQIDE